MVSSRLTRLVAMFCMTIGCVGSTAFGGEKTTTDVALQKDGVLMGRVVTVDGKAAAGQKVQILKASDTKAKNAVTLVTDSKGHFGVRGIKTGTYNIQTASSTNQVRLWNGKVAPPSAQNNIQLVQREVVIRAQNGGNSFLDLNGNGSAGEEIAIGSVVGAGIIFGVISANDDDPPPGS